MARLRARLHERALEAKAESALPWFRLLPVNLQAVGLIPRLLPDLAAVDLTLSCRTIPAEVFFAFAFHDGSLIARSCLQHLYAESRRLCFHDRCLR